VLQTRAYHPDIVTSNCILSAADIIRVGDRGTSTTHETKEVKEWNEPNDVTYFVVCYFSPVPF
jgi:hypothetical protein